MAGAGHRLESLRAFQPEQLAGMIAYKLLKDNKEVRAYRTNKTNRTIQLPPVSCLLPTPYSHTQPPLIHISHHKYKNIL
jgi:hypothetical protein